jgi:hypothetical protein
MEYPGNCKKCYLTHFDAQQMVIKASQIPYRYFAAGKITWNQHEHLAEQIDKLVWQLFFLHALEGVGNDEHALLLSRADSGESSRIIPTAQSCLGAARLGHF